MNYRTAFVLSTAVFFIAFAATAQMIDDADGDGIYDVDDNCSLLANAGQEDSDGDGFGNLCDADFTNDCIVGNPDFSVFRNCINQPGKGARSDCFDVDLNSDHKVNSLDFSIFESLFGLPPGPSGQATICDE